MPNLVVIGLVGLVAQFIDGSLGMGYGATSSSLLLYAGLRPALASATVHIAELGVNVVSGAAHWRLGNVDRRLVIALALPGGAGAFAGSILLASVPAHMARPVIAAFLCVLGLIILTRFARRRPELVAGPARPFARRPALPLGLLAGFADAAGGGGWGSITTSTLMARRGAVPRVVVGSVNASEPVVTLAAALGFLVSLGWQAVNLPLIGALAAGGLIAAPLAARMVSRLPQRFLGVMVAGAILFTNLGTLTGALQAPPPVSVGVFAIFSLAWLAALVYMVPRRQAARMPAPLQDAEA